MPTRLLRCTFLIAWSVWLDSPSATAALSCEEAIEDLESGLHDDLHSEPDSRQRHDMTRFETLKSGERVYLAPNNYDPKNLFNAYQGKWEVEFVAKERGLFGPYAICRSTRTGKAFNIPWNRFLAYGHFRDEVVPPKKFEPGEVIQLGSDLES